MAPSVGFDFDLCIAQGITLISFTMLIEISLKWVIKLPTTSKEVKVILEKSIHNFYDKLAQNEISGVGHIFRPSFLKLLPKLIKLRQEGKVSKIFIYSNNGFKELIDISDHILALIMKKAPYNIRDDQLIQEDDGKLHVLTPRIHIDNTCRLRDPFIGKFREKTSSGILDCVGETSQELWFLDDTNHHRLLKDEIGERYIQVEPYNAITSNSKLAEAFIQAFSIKSFFPGSPIATILIKEINRITPGFRPTGKEDMPTLIKDFTRVLNKSFPEGKYGSKGWSIDTTNSDYTRLERGLHKPMNPTIKLESDTPSVYRNVIGGARYRKTRKHRKDKKTC